MNTKQIWKNLFLIVMLTFSAITYAAQTTTTTNKNIYTEDSLNILATADQPQFTLKLKSNPTTGYSWFLREYDGNVLTPIKHIFQAPDSKLMGAPGYEIWTFRVKPTGFLVPQQTTIRMIYARPWQGADNSTQLIFRVTTQGKSAI